MSKQAKTDALYQAAESLVARGDLVQAMAALKRLLAKTPLHVPALRLLGKLHLHKDEVAQGVPLLQKAARLAPKDGEVAFEAGVANLRQGGWGEAETLFRLALSLNPAHAQAAFNLAWALRRQGNNAEAAVVLGELTSRDPANAAAWFNLGQCLSEMKRYDGATDAYKLAIKAGYSIPDATASLGVARLRLGDVETAQSLARKLQSAAPEHPATQSLLLEVAQARHDDTEALAWAERILTRAPGDAAIQLRRAQLLKGKLERDDIVAELGRALAMTPTVPEVLAVWADEAWRHGATDEAWRAIRTAESLVPRSLPVLSVLGKILALSGQLGAAQEVFGRCVEIDPDNHGMHSNFLFASLFDATLSPQEIFARHLTFGRSWESRFPEPDWNRDGESAERRLRIGYVSPDLCDHAVAFFLEPLLQFRDRARFEVFCYHIPRRRDTVTARLRGLVDHWRELGDAVPLDQAIAAVREDKIDILVDLAGHTNSNLLPLFAAKPAPLQMSMIGYPATTGLTRMDYRLVGGGGVNGLEVPELNSEKLLPFLAGFPFMPPANAPEVVPPPVLTNGHVTFGALNKYAKASPEVRRCWGRILAQVPGARLLVVCPGGDDEAVRTQVRDAFAAEDAPADRVDVVGERPLERWLDLFGQIDISLDPFPYRGGTSTMLSQWMGVPVVTLDDTLSYDNGSCRSCLTEQEYVAAAITMASDPAGLARRRADGRAAVLLRQTRRARQATWELEIIYRMAWRRWLGR